MSVDSIPFWSVVDTCLAFGLFMQVVMLVRVLLGTRQALWRWLLVLLPLAVSAWCFIVALDAMSGYMSFTHDVSLHMPPSAYFHLRAQALQALYACQFQAALTSAVFLLLFLAETRLLPRVKRPPLWVLVKEDRFRPW